MVTREWLLKNGFEWREYSNNDYGEHSGEYVLHRYDSDYKFLILLKYKDEGYRSGDPATWFVLISNSSVDRRVELRNALNVPIKVLKDAVRLCGIKIRFKNV